MTLLGCFFKIYFGQMLCNKMIIYTCLNEQEVKRGYVAPWGRIILAVVATAVSLMLNGQESIY